MKCIFYFKKLNDIGGVESFIYYLSKKFDFEFYYKEGNPGFEEQIKRLSYNVPVKKYKGEKLVCDKFFVNYNPDIINNVEAKEKIFLIHCDYGQVKFAPPNPKLFDRIIGVSQLVCGSYEKITGVKPELCYNPVYIDKPKVKKKPGLHIIYAGRMSSEKNGILIDKFKDVMDRSGIKYDLSIYTDRAVHFKSKNIIIKKPKLDLTKEMAEASFMLVTSKHEAYCLSAVESLYLGTPLICTDLPVFKELGIDDTNSIKIGFNLEGFNPNDLLKKFDFSYTPPKDNWGKYLPKKSGKYDPNQIVKVRVLKKKLWLVEEDKHLLRDDTLDLPIIRANYLVAKGYVDICN